MSTAPGAPPDAARHPESGVLSLEAVWALPLLVLLGVGFLHTVGVARDVLVAHEAARAGARIAATTSGRTPVVAAVRQAAPELDAEVTVTPTARRDGDVATVRVEVRRRVGPMEHTIAAEAVARVEPAVGRGHGPNHGGPP